jgi:iron complex transport system substrate-binding protein
MRIICLSAESADICARLGAWDDVVAVSAFASQEGLERRSVIGGFSTGDALRVAALRPDLVIGFSDVQADIAAQLIRAGCNVLITNQRSLTEIAGTIRLIGGAIGRAPAAESLATQFLRDLDTLRTDTAPRPLVYFEEWPDPPISAIGWVGELLEWCGGEDIFAPRRGRAARQRGVALHEIVDANPDIILASWCGKKVDVESIRRRPGFETTRAVRDHELHALDSDILLQPGPRVLEGARVLRTLFDTWRTRQP